MNSVARINHFVSGLKREDVDWDESRELKQILTLGETYTDQCVAAKGEEKRLVFHANGMLMKVVADTNAKFTDFSEPIVSRLMIRYLPVRPVSDASYPHTERFFNYIHSVGAIRVHETGGISWKVQKTPAHIMDEAPERVQEREPRFVWDKTEHRFVRWCDQVGGGELKQIVAGKLWITEESSYVPTHSKL